MPSHDSVSPDDDSPDEDIPLGNPADALALIERERANLVRDIAPDPRLMYWPWGFAWLLGFGLFFLRFGPGGRVYADLPDWLPIIALMLLFIAAGVTTGFAGSRPLRRTSGPSSRAGLIYGWSWSISFFSFSVLFSRLAPELPDPKAGLLWAGGMVALTGALHMAGSAIWQDRQLFVLGAWTSAVNIAGIVAGPGWHSLIVGASAAAA
ncbi:transporter [Paractinoplanes durhamensis]|uniref:transporter n=1 Tax=Paractinoplanes durhamensis TaxID=113563 RepID=UPI0036380E8B